MEDNYKKERLSDLEQDMNDTYKSWQDSEKELIGAREWRNKQALYYAESAVAYYNYKREIHGNL